MDLTPLFNFESAKFAAIERGLWQTTILAGTIGSTIHGTNVNDGVEDWDIMGVCVEPMRRVIGFQEFEQMIYRTAIVRQQAEIALSQEKGNAEHPILHKGGKSPCSRAGDIDLTIYSLRKYLRLALKGNPTILTLLFVPEDSLLAYNNAFDLQALAPYIVSKRAGGAYLGYMQAQKQRLLGERGGRHGSRPELINKYGYDSKYAAHVLRLGYQGIELLSTGRLSLPMQEGELECVRTIRLGEMEFDTCLNLLGTVERSLKDAIEQSQLQSEPDTDYVESWMIRTYQEMWERNNRSL